jgi:ATP-dependent Clp protease ATP-binding subunit ClpA
MRTRVAGRKHVLIHPTPTPRAGHNYIGTEHILLGLLREGEGVAARVLETLGADPSKIRTQVWRAGGARTVHTPPPLRTTDSQPARERRWQRRTGAAGRL